jgi:hypothetical protein
VTFFWSAAFDKWEKSFIAHAQNRAIAFKNEVLTKAQQLAEAAIAEAKKAKGPRQVEKAQETIETNEAILASIQTARAGFASDAAFDLQASLVTTVRDPAVKGDMAITFPATGQWTFADADELKADEEDEVDSSSDMDISDGSDAGGDHSDGGSAMHQDIVADHDEL